MSQTRRTELRAQAELQALVEQARGDQYRLRNLIQQRATQMIHRGNDDDQVTAVQMLNQIGFRIGLNAQGQLVAQRSGTGPGLNVATEPQRTNGRRPKPGGWRDESWSRGEYETRQRELANEVIMTPESSNVYSFTYHRSPGQRLGTLYVTYKAPALNSTALSVGRNASGFRQVSGRQGRTVTGKTNNPGPTYAYLSVPPAVFTAMKSAQSKGKFVWDKLRVRGSIHGHQYRYVLTKGALIETSQGPNFYVPRKATKNGFMQRAVASTVQREGRRGYVVSTLPPTPIQGRR